MSQQGMSDPKKIQEAVTYAAELKKSGLSGTQIEGRLMETGLDQPTAARVVAHSNQGRPGVDKSKATGDMLLGAVICIIGIVVTVATLAAASGGGTYIVAWGAILFGGFRFIRGLVNFLR